MIKIITTLALGLLLVGCSTEETPKEDNPVIKSQKITDGSVKEGYIGKITNVKKTNGYGGYIIDTVGLGNNSKVYLVDFVTSDGGDAKNKGEIMFLDFSGWSCIDKNEPTYYNQGDYLVQKIENGKIYFLHNHKWSNKWVQCDHVLDVSGLLVKDEAECYLGGLSPNFGMGSHGYNGEKYGGIGFNMTGFPDYLISVKK